MNPKHVSEIEKATIINVVEVEVFHNGQRKDRFCIVKDDDGCTYVGTFDKRMTGKTGIRFDHLTEIVLPSDTDISTAEHFDTCLNDMFSCRDVECSTDVDDAFVGCLDRATSVEVYDFNLPRHMMAVGTARMNVTVK